MLRDPYSLPGKISDKDPLREGTISMVGRRLRKRAGIVSCVVMHGTEMQKYYEVSLARAT